MPTLTTLQAIPPFAIGHVREMRVRWALEEIGMPYDIRTVGPDEQASPAYRRAQPFGQVPVLETDGLPVFESGAILMQLGESSPVLLPTDPQERLQTVMWMFAALNSVEPHTGALASLLAFSANEAWAIERRPSLEAVALKRLRDVDAWLADRDYLVGRFTAADILMTSVIRQLDRSGLVERFPHLHAYKLRCTARPAFRKALADHTALYAPEAASA